MQLDIINFDGKKVGEEKHLITLIKDNNVEQVLYEIKK